MTQVGLFSPFLRKFSKKTPTPHAMLCHVTIYQTSNWQGQTIHIKL